MNLLTRKAFREIRGIKGQAFAIVALVASGVAVFVGMSSTHDSMDRSRNLYYRTARFADLFAPLRRAPDTLVDQIRDLPFVAFAEGRLVSDVPARVEAFTEPITSHLVSLPAPHGMHQLTLLRGRLPAADAEDEVLVNDGFAKAHGFALGDAFTLLLMGQWRNVRVTGVAMSPEFIYPIRPGDIMPDEAHYAIVWMDRGAMGQALRMSGAINDLLVKLVPGTPFAEARTRIDGLLAPHGGLGAFGRSDHDSHRFLSDDIRQLKNQATVLPPIFFGVAAFLIGMVLSRLVSMQRTEIGTLKALGYTNATIGFHYAQIALVLLAAGIVVGSLLGWWLGQGLTTMYVEYYRLPTVDFRLSWKVVGTATATCAIILGLAVLGAARRAMRLAPAEAMRPEPPATYRATWLDRSGVMRHLGPVGKMVLRHLLRRFRRSAMTMVGGGAALAIVLASLYFGDAMEALIHLQFQVAQREDLSLTFAETLPREVLHDLARFPGVARAEGYRVLPARLRAGHRSRRLGILAWAKDGQLRRLLDGRNVRALPDEGVALSAVLAERLGVGLGDFIAVEPMEKYRHAFRIPVTAVVHDWAGIAAVMNAESLETALDGDDGLSGAYVRVDQAGEKDLYRSLWNQPRIAGVAQKQVVVKAFRDTAAKFVLVFSAVLVFFAFVILAGVLYNAARVSFAERQRELGTLRVLGLTRRETWWVGAGELAIQAFFSIPLGFLMGAGLIVLAASLMSSELYRIPLLFAPATFAYGALVMLLGLGLVALLLSRWVSSLDFIAVLKTRE